MPYLHGHSKSGRAKGEDCARWKGGRCRNSNGYIMVLAPDHPRVAGRRGYVLEHHLVMEKRLGRYLEPGEIVHHLNGIKDDNRDENLELMLHGEHSALHATGRIYSGEARRRMVEAGKKGAAARWGNR